MMLKSEVEDFPRKGDVVYIHGWFKQRIGIIIDSDAIQGKLPTKDYLTGTANADGDIEANEMTGEVPATISSAAISQIASEVSTDAFGNIITQKLVAFLD